MPQGPERTAPGPAAIAPEGPAPVGQGGDLIMGGRIVLALRRHRRGLGRRALRAAVGVNNAALHRALTDLVARGQIIRTIGLAPAGDGQIRERALYHVPRCQPGSAFRSPSSPLRYPGGKSKLLRHIAPLLAPALAKAEAFAEPCGGGGSTALWVAENHPKMKIILNDLDPEIAAVWRVVVGDEHEALAARASLADGQARAGLCATAQEGHP
jgi:hypothetical protein